MSLQAERAMVGRPYSTDAHYRFDKGFPACTRQAFFKVESRSKHVRKLQGRSVSFSLRACFDCENNRVFRRGRICRIRKCTPVHASGAVALPFGPRCLRSRPRCTFAARALFHELSSILARDRGARSIRSGREERHGKRRKHPHPFRMRYSGGHLKGGSPIFGGQAHRRHAPHARSLERSRRRIRGVRHLSRIPRFLRPAYVLRQPKRPQIVRGVSERALRDRGVAAYAYKNHSADFRRTGHLALFRRPLALPACLDAA